MAVAARRGRRATRSIELDPRAGGDAAGQARQGADPCLPPASGPRAREGGWDEWKDRDLLLVPEKDEEGNHRYYASAYDTFTFRFFKK